MFPARAPQLMQWRPPWFSWPTRRHGSACDDVHHTDGEREWAYDRTSPVGRLARALDEAPKRGWTIVDMKRDWNRIYAFQP